MSNKNTLLALNDVLFDQLQKLNDPKLEGDNLELELRKSKAMTDIGKTIISNASLVLKAQVAKDEKLGTYNELPALLGGKE